MKIEVLAPQIDGREEAHILGLFTSDGELIKLEVNPTRDKENLEMPDRYYSVLSGRNIAHFLASRWRGAGEESVVVEFDQAGRFVKAS